MKIKVIKATEQEIQPHFQAGVRGTVQIAAES